MSAQETPRAFPSASIDDAFGGMTMLDYVAAQAFPHMFYVCRGDSRSDRPAGEDFAEYCAVQAYHAAEAFMAERERRS